MRPKREKPIPLRERDLELLASLQVQLKWGGGWARPMDLGAWDASWHSASLRKMVRMGLVEKRTRGSNRSYEYRYLKHP